MVIIWTAYRVPLAMLYASIKAEGPRYIKGKAYFSFHDQSLDFNMIGHTEF